MGDQEYQEYLACVSQAQADAASAKSAYDAEVLAAKNAFLQLRTDDAEYYNSDDEDEQLCTAAPIYPPKLPRRGTPYATQPRQILGNKLARLRGVQVELILKCHKTVNKIWVP